MHCVFPQECNCLTWTARVFAMVSRAVESLVLVHPLCIGCQTYSERPWFPTGLARTLSSEEPTALRALRRLGATRARHRIGRHR